MTVIFRQEFWKVLSQTSKRIKWTCYSSYIIRHIHSTFQHTLSVRFWLFLNCYKINEIGGSPPGRTENFSAFLCITIKNKARILFNLKSSVILFLPLLRLISWGCRIHQLLLCRRISPGSMSVQDMTLNNSEVPVMLEFGGMLSTPSLPLVPDPLWPGVGVTDRVLSMYQIELNCILILNWITWNRTVLIFQLRTYPKLNYLK